MFKKSIEEVLRQMCTYVNVEYENVNFNEDSWFVKHSWKIEDERNFVKWMEDYLYNNTQARKDIMGYPIKKKKQISDCVRMFVFNYGWKVND